MEPGECGADAHIGVEALMRAEMPGNGQGRGQGPGATDIDIAERRALGGHFVTGAGSNQVDRDVVGEEILECQFRHDLIGRLDVTGDGCTVQPDLAITILGEDAKCG